MLSQKARHDTATTQMAQTSPADAVVFAAKIMLVPSPAPSDTKLPTHPTTATTPPLRNTPQRPLPGPTPGALAPGPTGAWTESGRMIRHAAWHAGK
jgi:hypothetical protein